MHKDIMRNIALTIVRAQACSDAGKGIYSLEIGDEVSNHLIDKEYAEKDQQILKAINIINRLSSETAGVKFDVVRDTSGVAYYLCYFTYYIRNQKRQISFHSFDIRLAKYCRDSLVRWDRGCSRANADELIWYFGL